MGPCSISYSLSCTSSLVCVNGLRSSHLYIYLSIYTLAARNQNSFPEINSIYIFFCRFLLFFDWCAHNFLSTFSYLYCLASGCAMWMNDTHIHTQCYQASNGTFFSFTNSAELWLLSLLLLCIELNFSLSSRVPRSHCLFAISLFLYKMVLESRMDPLAVYHGATHQTTPNKDEQSCGGGDDWTTTACMKEWNQKKNSIEKEKTHFLELYESFFRGSVQRIACIWAHEIHFWSDFFLLHKRKAMPGCCRFRFR